MTASPLISHSEPARGFDVNDVTFVFPLNQKNQTKAYPDVALNNGKGGQILSASLFSKIDHQAHKLSQMDSRYPLKDWRVVALRYDPCFPKSALAPETCLEQIRLIAQPFSGSGFQDVSMHLLFQISEGARTPNARILNSLLAIKNLSAAKTQGVPLVVHPGLEDELKKYARVNGPVAEQLLQLIKTYGQQKNLKEVTFTDADFNNNGPWFFMGGRIEKENWVLDPIPGVKNKALLQTTDENGFISDNVPAENIGITPFMTFDDQGLGIKQTLAESEVYRLHRTENPKFANPRNTDCASCHVVASKQFAFKLDDKESSYLFRSPVGITGYSLASNHPNGHSGLGTSEVVRVLGYSMQSAIITPLAAASSALVASQLNTFLKLPPPTTRDCRGQEAALKFCLLGFDNSALLNSPVDTKACFDQHCRNSN